MVTASVPTQDSTTEYSSAVAGWLVVLNVVGVVVGYTLMLVMAHQLSPEQFDHCVGSIALLTMLAAFAEAGVGKLGYQVIPLALAAHTPQVIRGYARFCWISCFAISTVLIASAMLAEPSFLGESVAESSLVSILFLPAVAGCGLAADLLISLRQPLLATSIARLLVPATTLLLIWHAGTWLPLDEVWFVVYFGCGSLVGLILCGGFVRRSILSLEDNHTTELRWRQWLWGGVSFWMIGFTIAWLLKAPLVILHHIPHGASELALLAPAFETGSLVLLLSKSADKYYWPIMAVALDRRALGNDELARRKRDAIVGGGALLFLFVIFKFGKEILQLFGEEFIAAHAALCWISIGVCVWTYCSLSTTALLFMGETRRLSICLALHGLAMLVLVPWYFSRLGITGVGMAFAGCVVSCALITRGLEWYARREQSSKSLLA